MENEILIAALRDRFQDQPEVSAEPDVIKKPGAPTLIKDKQGNWQTMEPAHPEFMETPRLPHEEQERIKADAESRQADRVEVAKRLAQRVEEDHYRALIEGAQPPAGKTGREDRNFFEDWKHIWAPKPEFAVECPDLLGDTPEQIAARATFLEVHTEYIDWKATWGLRDIVLSGFEASKSARPGRNLAPVPSHDILEEIQKRVSPQAAPIRDNRFRYSEK
jgi:hypothetical protein